MSYAPQGSIAHITAGSGSGALSEDWSYNNRLQPASIALGSLLTMSFEYSSTPNDNTHNNGNVLTQTLAMKKTDGTNVSLKQYYQYDGANRLTQVAEYQTSGTPACPDGTSQWCENFGYDNFGNRLITARSGFSPPLNEPQGYNTANNRITGTGWQYDNGVSNYRGNITADPAPNSYTYDAESRLTHYSGIGATTDYSYDGDGQRVKKVSGATTTVFVYDAEGELAAEYTTPAPGLGGRRFFSVDHLGSTRLITDAGGGVLERHDYRPFGDEVTFTAGQVRAGVAGYGVDQGTREKFTGKVRDVESGLDYFGARYLSGAQGRFTSPDLINLTNERLLKPSSTLNKYTYAQNNPLLFVDPDGQDAVLYYDASGLTGHVMMLAYNQQTGDSAIKDYGPAGGPQPSNELIQFVGGPVDGVDDYNLPRSLDDLRQNYASLTVQTTPEAAQGMIDAIRSTYGNEPKQFNAIWGTNCATSCSDVFKDLGIGRPRTPAGLWTAIFKKYGRAKRSSWSLPFMNIGNWTNAPHNPGTDYGNRRNGFDPFQLLDILLHPPKACVTTTDSATGTTTTTCE